MIWANESPEPVRVEVSTVKSAQKRNNTGKCDENL